MSALPEKQDILVAVITKAQKNGFVVPAFIRGIDIEIAFPSLIYRHDFAKAFWGEMMVSSISAAWEDHLVKMVVAPDPIEYLENFLVAEDYPI